MGNDPGLSDYYAKRAGEYEQVYDKPERQQDLGTLRMLMRDALSGRVVLELACGTGYWTQVIARTATSIVATDINDETLQIARSKDYGTADVSFKKLDAFHVDEMIGGHFNAGLAAFWWSHLPKREVRQFLQRFHGALKPHALVVFADNRFVAGSSTAIRRTDADGNMYQTRRLQNGEEHEVLKNFPDEKEIQTVLEDLATDIRWTQLMYYWFLTYRTKA